MKLHVSYATTETKRITDCSYSHIYKDAELVAKTILRLPVGRGAAATRYNYYGWFESPEDAEYAHNGEIYTYINRKKNPRFNPKSLTWVDNVSVIWGIK